MVLHKQTDVQWPLPQQTRGYVCVCLSIDNKEDTSIMYASTGPSTKGDHS